MTDSSLTQIQTLLAGLSQDINKMQEVTSEQLDIFMGALDDIAAHTLAVQGILKIMMKTHPVDAGEVRQWILDNSARDEQGNAPEKALALAAYLITGEKS